MKFARLTLLLGLWLPSAFALQYDTAHVNCENGNSVVENDLKNRCKNIFKGNKDLIPISITKLETQASDKSNLSCRFRAVYVCAAHQTEPCEKAEAKRMALMDGYNQAIKLKDEDPQMFADAVHQADTEITEACKLIAPVRTELVLAPGAAVRD
jgi:hypothetical protein